MCSARACEPPKDVSAAQLAECLLPQPRSVHARGGWCDLPDPTPTELPGTWARSEANALKLLADTWRGRLEITPPDRQPPPGAKPPGNDVCLVINKTSNSGPGSLAPQPAQGYTLSVSPRRVLLEAGSDTGLFHGLQTLRQIARLCGRRWPCLEIDDAPAFATRGVSWDVSRGRVPTLDVLKTLAHRLALLKGNQLQLYVEHTFAFAFDPDISAGASPLTADEIRALDAHCAQMHIELVPSLAAFGHMGRVLSLPRYRHLAEVSCDESWERMTWRQRVRGLTLDVSNPQSRELLTRMYDEYLPLFSADRVNVSCDETYDLGRGRGRERAAQVSPQGMFREHLCWLRDLCARYGKRIMFWGDMLKKYPELLGEIDADSIVLNWGYAADADYQSTKLFRDAGLRTFVCPGTSAWNRFVSDINTADANVRGQAAAGRAYGAEGLLMTDWGDEGHVAPPACSWHPLALAASLAWNPERPASEEFDRAFGGMFLGPGGANAVAAWRAALRASDMVRTWPAFCTPLDRLDEVPERFDPPALQHWRAQAELAAAAFAAVEPADAHAGLDRDEMVVAFRLHALAGRRLELGRRLTLAPAIRDVGLSDDLRALADACEAIVPQYESAWLARCKPANLNEISDVFKRLAREARARADERDRQ
jgi:hypothetical protein